MDSKRISHDGSFVPVLREESLLNVTPRIPPPLDPGFRPFVLGSRNYMKATQRFATTDFHFAVERHRGLTCRFVVPCFDEGHDFFIDSCFYIERKIKFVLWQRGGCKLYICGNAKLCKFLVASYSAGGARAFDAELMSRAYKVPFQTIVCASSSDLPEAMEDSLTLGVVCDVASILDSDFCICHCDSFVLALFVPLVSFLVSCCEGPVYEDTLRMYRCVVHCLLKQDVKRGCEVLFFAQHDV